MCQSARGIVQVSYAQKPKRARSGSNSSNEVTEGGEREENNYNGSNGNGTGIGMMGDFESSEATVNPNIYQQVVVFDSKEAQENRDWEATQREKKEYLRDYL